MALPANRGLLQQVVNFVERQRGIPYTWGGTTRAGGFDCSGLIYAAYRAAGYTGIGRTTYDQIQQGMQINPAQAHPGDLVFSSPHHVGLYVGNGMVVSAPHAGADVHQIPLSEFGGIYQVRRLIGGGGGVTPPRGGAYTGPGGLPVARAGGGNQAGSAALNGMVLRALSRPIQIKPTQLNLPTAQATLAKFYQSPPGQPQQPALGSPLQQPALPTGALPTLPDTRTPLGQTIPQSLADLSSRRRSLLGIA